MLVEILVTGCTKVWKIAFERLTIVHWHKNHARSSIPHCHYQVGHIHNFLLVVCSNKSLSCTVFDILPLLQCTWLHMTFKSSLVSKRQLKLQAMCAFQLMYKVIKAHWYCCHSTARPMTSYLSAIASTAVRLLTKPVGIQASILFGSYHKPG